ncbi:MAG: peroxidase family protein, partial [Saprospiraceae bacterium]|nr:peroxidase family protein [Saprospiraceae bacterium]
LPAYNGYQSNVNPQIFNEFSTAAFRMGHTLINGTILRMDNNGKESKEGNISLRDAFFNPYVVEFAGGVDAYFKGMGTQVQQEFDCKVIDDVRNFLFGIPGAGGLDLAAININRGRERGIADYNTIRTSLGLPKLSSFDELTDNPEEAELMESVYGDINNVDAWVGMLAETHVEGGLFGNLVTTMMERQFQVLREGDRFYFENMDFEAEEMEDVFAVTMRDILMRNTSIAIMQDEVFKAIPHESIEGGPLLNPFPLDAAIYPNPVQSSMQMKVYGSRDEFLTVSVVDYMGRMVSKTEHHIYEGNNTVQVDLNDCPRGYYNVVLDTEFRRSVLKMVKR